MLQLQGASEPDWRRSLRLRRAIDLRCKSTVQHPCQACGTGFSLVQGQWEQQTRSPLERTAYLLDGYWPEFDYYLQANRRQNDVVAIPCDGQRWRKPNYAWNLRGAGSVHQATWVTLQRSLAGSRFLPPGAARQTALLQMDARLAQWYADRVAADTHHWVVMQNLLPFLWQTGALAGRTFDVLMTRLPLSLLHDRWDWVTQQHPESSTRNNFRPDDAFVMAEAAALQAARFILTPHAEIAQHFRDQVIQLPWQMPIVTSQLRTGNRILFPAATVSDKGAYELRQVAQALALELDLLGPQLEGDQFWEGTCVRQATGDPLVGVGLVVLPASVEAQPRLLLRAIAAGIPVIASEACGLGEQKGVVTIPTGDAMALQQAIAAFLTGSSIAHTD